MPPARDPSAAGTASEPRRDPVWKKLALSAATVVVLFLLVEGALRVRQYARSGSFQHVHAMRVDPETGLPVPLAVEAPGGGPGAGFRSPPVEVPKSPGRLRFAFLGGSTTYCAEASSLEATWPARLVATLRERHPERELDYVNAGVAGYRVVHSLKALRTRVAPLDPDVVVVYHATNDLTRTSRELAVEQGLHDSTEGPDSWLSGVSLTWHLFEKNLQVWLRTRSAGERRALAFEGSELTAEFERVLTELVREAQEVADLVVVPTFSQRARRGQPPEVLAESNVTHFYYMPYMTAENVLEGFDAYNAAIRRVAAATGALLVEGEDAVPGDRGHFTDSVHFTDAGCERMAERVADALAASPRWAELVGE